MTTDHKSDSEAFREALIEEPRAGAGEHPGADALVGYLSGDLDADADERLRDHLSGCPECATTTLDLETIMEPDLPGQEGVADFEIESAWRSFESRVELLPARAKRWPMALAASLLVATVGLSVWVSQLLKTQSRLTDQIAAISKPQINPPIVYLDEVTRSEPTGAVAELAPDEPFVHFIAIPSAPELFTSYEAVFTDASGFVVWSSSELELTEEGSLRMWLPRALLPEGDYQVRIRGLGAGPVAREDAVIATSLRVLHR